MLTLQSRQWGRGGAEDAQSFAIVRGEIFRELARPANRFLQICVAHDYVRQRRKWRIGHRAPEWRFALVKCRIVLLYRVLNRVVLRIKSLNQDASRQIATACATGNLREQLEGALGGAKIRQAQRGIRADHTDQRDALEIMALREHLRASQNVERAPGERAERFLVLPLGSGGIAIEPRYSRAGKFFAQALLQMLGAFAEEIHVF